MDTRGESASAADTVSPTMREVRLPELLVGTEGLALLRHLYDSADGDADRRLAEVRQLVDGDWPANGEATAEASVREGYAAWAGTYDEPGNPIVALEQPAVWGLLDSVEPGRALDAACGTGRHARRLADLGHEVAGFDATPEMVDRARRKAPEATFAIADLRSIPEDDGAFDVAVCGLALSHLPKLDDAVAELARVLRPGGRLVVSTLHPFLAHLGWQAPFTGPDGGRAFVREHPHAHADYLGAFRAARLDVRHCLEPRLAAEHVRAKRRAFEHVPEAVVAAYAGLPGVLVWELEAAA